MTSPKNPFPQLSELLINLVPTIDGDESFSLQTTLRLGAQEIELDDDLVFQVRAKRAYLVLQGQGMEVDQTNKYGENIRLSSNLETEIETKIGSESELGAGSALGIGASGADASFDLHAKGTITSTKQKSERIAEKREVLHVKSIGGDTWEISEAERNRLLDGVYLHNTKLCRIYKHRGANRSSMYAVAYVRQRELDITLLDAPTFGRAVHQFTKSRNKERIVALMIAKSLNEELRSALGEDFEGIVTLSMDEASGNAESA